MKKTQAPKPTPKKAVRLDDMTRELALGLRDAIEETDSDYLKRDPEEAFVDLAARLIYQLRAKLTVVPVPSPEERVQAALDAAAARTLSILTDWIRKHPECSYDTRKSPSGKFQIVLKTPRGVQLFFGDDIQDAYAQMAQTVHFNES